MTRPFNYSKYIPVVLILFLIFKPTVSANTDKEAKTLHDYTSALLRLQTIYEQLTNNVLDLMDSDTILISFQEGEITKDYAVSRCRELLFRCKLRVTSIKEQLNDMPTIKNLMKPGAWENKKFYSNLSSLYRYLEKLTITTEEFIDQYYGALTQLLSDTLPSQDQIYIRFCQRFIILLEGENILLENTNLSLNKSHPQYFLNISVYQANEAMISIFQWFKHLFATQIEGSSEDYLTQASKHVRILSSAIIEGQIATANFIGKLKKSSSNWNEKEKQFATELIALLNTYNESFKIENEITELLKTFIIETYNLGTSEPQESSEYLEMLGTKIDLLVQKRTNLIKYRIEHLGHSSKRLQ